MKLKLSYKIVDYLNYNWCKGFECYCVKQFCKNKTADFIIVEMSEDMIEQIYDWANEQLCLKGFDEHYELNTEGEILEEISDLFLR